MNELAITGNWEAFKEQASMLVKSGFLPQSVKTSEQAIAIALTSKELGIGMMEGFRSINVIQGKPTISPQLMLALANRSGQLENIKIDSTDERCVITVKRKGRDPHTEEFGVKEASGLGLIGRDNYKKQPAVMFKWRALAANLRVTFPDVMIGFYTPEEMGAEVKIGEGDVMEVVAQPEEYPTGIRLPAGVLKLMETDPEAAQERIGKGFFAKKTPHGWYLFTKEKVSDDFLQKKVDLEAQDSIQNESQDTPKTSKDAFVSPENVKELMKLLKDKEIDMDSFKSFVQDELKAKGMKTILDKDYPRVVEWIIRNAGAEVGHE